MRTKSVIIGLTLLLSVLLITGCFLIKTTSSASSEQHSLTVSTQSSMASDSGNTVSQDSSSDTASVSESASSSTGEKSLTGIFEEIEVGDYMHLYMQGDDGLQYDFFILHNVGVAPETLVPGQKITVFWRNVDNYLSEISQTVNMDEITRIELVT